MTAVGTIPDDGRIDVTFNGQRVTIDLLDLWARFEEHGREYRDDPDYAATLPKLAVSMGLPEMSQRAALRFFARLTDIVNSIKSRKAPCGLPWKDVGRLTRFYGSFAGRLPRLDAWALLQVMPAVRADEALRERGSEMSERELYWLTYAATGDAEQAEDAWLQRVEEKMRAGQTPETYW